MIKSIKLYVNKCTFMFPFLLGAFFCSLWGGFFNLLTFLLLGYIAVKILAYVSSSRVVVEV